MDKYELHSGISIPNIANVKDKTKLKYGDVIAIEPFSTVGDGHVISGKGSNIYLIKSQLKSRIIREKRIKILFQNIKNRFGSLPFAQRWCENMSNDIDITLRKLTFLGIIKHYPQLIEQSKNLVSQMEHTVIVNEDGCEVTTNL